ncbi:hypothetical protein FOZ62_021880, partial [Perkinsus olseni]
APTMILRLHGSTIKRPWSRLPALLKTDPLLEGNHYCDLLDGVFARRDIEPHDVRWSHPYLTSGLDYVHSDHYRGSIGSRKSPRRRSALVSPHPMAALATTPMA